MDLRARRGLIGSKGQVIPEGYERLEYIQKQGTNARIPIAPTYINLQIGDIIRLRMSCIKQQSGTQCFIGYPEQWDAEIRSNMGIAVWNGVTKILPAVSQITVGKAYDFAYRVADDRGLKGVNYGVYRYGAGSYPFYGRLYSMSVEREGEKLINLIPARRGSDGMIGCFDTVQEIFITSPAAWFEAPESEQEG